MNLSSLGRAHRESRTFKGTAGVLRSGAWLLALGLAAAPACSGDDDAENDGAGGRGSEEDDEGRGRSGSGGSNTGSGASGNGSSGSGASSGGSVDGGFIGDGLNVLELCGGPCACADGIDNDGDNVMDGFDLECTGPADDDEGSFATGIPGDNMDPKWQDCFFDGNSGAGNDGCRYHTDCLTGDRPQDDPDCSITQQCIDFCYPRTPPGCDCFGCCTIRADGAELNVVISAQCQEDNLADCVMCTKSTMCDNDCGECELCPGRTVADLPASCHPPPPGGGSGGSGSGGSGGNDGAAGNPGYTCDDGTFYCNEQDDCPSTSYYCSFGCCRLTSPD
jgi:hypothetical protein